MIRRLLLGGHHDLHVEDDVHDQPCSVVSQYMPEPDTNDGEDYVGVQFEEHRYAGTVRDDGDDVLTQLYVVKQAGGHTPHTLPDGSACGRPDV